MMIGFDMSGRKSNYEYLGIVIGTDEKINNLTENLGLDSYHIKRIRKKTDINKLENIKFDDKDIIAFCLKLCIKTVIDKIPKLNINKKNPKQILNLYNKILMQEIENKITPFLCKHNTKFTDIVIQCDGDCMPLCKAAKIKYTYQGNAYRLSDYVAGRNTRQKPLKGVHEIDHVDEMYEKLKKNLR